jgi:hypothetical protein
MQRQTGRISVGMLFSPTIPIEEVTQVVEVFL